MDDLEELKSLEDYIHTCLFNGQSYSDIGVDIATRYIKLIEKIEGKKETAFGRDVIQKYRYLMPLSEIRNRAFFNGELF